MHYPEQQPPGGPERLARLAVPIFLMLSMVTLAFGLGFLVHDLTTDSGSSPGSITAPVTDDGHVDEDSVGAAILNEIYQILSSQHVDRDDLSEEGFFRSAIEGIIDSLNDPHTDYLSPEEVEAGALDLSSSYEGIGASVSDASGEVTIVAPFRDSPAEDAGVRAGDVIREVDGEPTDGWTDQQAVQEIRGPAGTEVTLTLERTDGTIEEVTVVRGDILIQSIFTDPPLELIPGESGDAVVDRDGNAVDDVAYLNIAQFHDQTLEELHEALDGVEDGDYVGLILDVRSNPGGLLSSTVDVVNEFLEEGEILSEVSGENERTWTAESGGMATNIPIVVLQDEGSASGAEVLAAALRDNDRATVIGTQSFGKGTVNQVRHLENCGDPEGCGALYLSVGRWLTPGGKQIEGTGVGPDIEVPMEEQDYLEQGDIQVFEAIDFLRENQ